jgi:TonB family protein
LALPVQYHGDVLSSTVVEAMVGRDGLVISARVINNSGSGRADADALALARRARFNPVNSAENVPVVGKLIFEWFALSLADTNSVKR